MMAEPISLETYYRWDVAGIDGLALMKAWFGEPVERIAPFQSLETEWQGQPCSLLRLCEGNFRLSTAEKIVWPSIPAGLHVWLKQFDWLGAIAIPETALEVLQGIVIPKQPYRLQGLQVNCAIPARLNGIAILIWRHAVAESALLEIQTAQTDLPKIVEQLRLQSTS
jgi:hypothetical protein